MPSSGGVNKVKCKLYFKVGHPTGFKICKYVITVDTTKCIGFLDCCTVHFEDSLNITQPTNAPIVYYVLV
jgi:hypothetical protein